MSRAYVLLFDGYADWELGNVLAELRRLCQIEVVTAGFSAKAVVSMGGLRVTPDTVISQIDIRDVLLFILPGGYLWENEYPAAELEPLLHRLENAEIPIAAICAATTVLARAGLLHGRKHTSNSIDYLSKMVPEYAEHSNYVNSLSTRDGHVITASGLGAVDFTMEVLNELGLSTPEIKTIWYEAFKHGQYPDDFEHNA